MINGLNYDWESVTATAPSGILFDITKITYSDEQGKKPSYGKGGIARGYGRENYQASGNMEMGLFEWERLKTTLGVSVYDHIPFPITVSYADLGLPPVIDILPQIAITKVSTDNSQGSDKAGSKSIDFIILKPIIYNGKPAKI